MGTLAPCVPPLNGRYELGRLEGTGGLSSASVMMGMRGDTQLIG